jgi:hypothetical protein
MSDRVEPTPDSEPEGRGIGKVYAPQTGTTFLGFGAFVRSIIAAQPEPAQPLVSVDLEGKWNHGAKDRLSILLSPELALELAALLKEAAPAAREDVIAWRRSGGR